MPLTARAVYGQAGNIIYGGEFDLSTGLFDDTVYKNKGVVEQDVKPVDVFEATLSDLMGHSSDNFNKLSFHIVFEEHINPATKCTYATSVSKKHHRRKDVYIINVNDLKFTLYKNKIKKEKV